MRKRSNHGPVKVCYISFREELETNIEQISRKVSEYGYHVTIINISNKPKIPEFTQDGREILFIPISDKKIISEKIRVRLKRLLFIFKVARKILNRDFEIIHIDANCRYYFFLKLLFRKVKLVYHIQSYPVSISKNRFNSIKTILGAYLQSFFASAVIIQDEKQKKRWFGINRLKKTKIVPVGFNRQILYPYSDEQKSRKRMQLGIEPHKLVLIYAGAITAQRKLDRLIAAIKKVHDVNNQLMVLFVGDGPNINQIKEQCSSLCILHKFIFTGKVKYEKMVEYYGMSDIGLSYIPINSNYTNNPPLKTYEYLACGLPCIATNTESNSMIIKNNINGLLVDDSVEAISEAVLSLWNDKIKLENFKWNAPLSVKAFDFDTITNQYILPLYHDIL